MKTKSIFILLILGISVLVLGACNVLVPVTGGDAAATQVQSTVNAIFTQSAFETLVAGQGDLPTQTPAAAEPTATPWIITATPVPATPTPVFTATPLPTATNIPLPTATPVPCDWLSFVSDVTIPDGTSFAPGESFVKTWRIKNIGSCSWVPGYALVFSDGNSMSGASSVALTTTVAPGQSVDVSVTLVAPKDEGDYTGNWKMRSAGGVVFGGGANANKPFWVKINVKSVASNDPKKPYVLVLNYCAAEWRSNAGLLNCPTAEGANGAVYRVNEPVLEGGYKDDEPAIVMIPGSGDGGMVQGKFPAYTVQASDEFRALIGCMDASKNCNAMVQLNYSADGGAVQNLGTWTQTSDGNFDRINISLASLVGKKVQFYLVVYNNGNSSDDRIFWLMPHVYNPTK